MTFRMEGRTVQLIRFIVSYEEPARLPKRKGNNEPEPHTYEPRTREEWCVSAAHKDEVEAKLIAKEIPFTTTVIDQSGNEWFDGLQFASYDEAAAVLAAGEQAYLDIMKQTPEAKLDELQTAVDVLILDALMGVATDALQYSEASME